MFAIHAKFLIDLFDPVDNQNYENIHLFHRMNCKSLF